MNEEVESFEDLNGTSSKLFIETKFCYPRGESFDGGWYSYQAYTRYKFLKDSDNKLNRRC
ncbi:MULTISPECIES: hypothetical protein [Okeania]|uniref:hypothetical protein n=1 Tax=Okeania TaxID=1458928 RepID=UPI000F52BB16|nr:MULTISPECIES: hypothetical protein [Okeania]NET78553.1 hypothetical protein [Okeania sp. SIO1F9]RQH10391.1 hypothetical protein D4Z78_27885 [Okeania hirsuta]